MSGSNQESDDDQYSHLDRTLDNHSNLDPMQTLTNHMTMEIEPGNKKVQKKTIQPNSDRKSVFLKNKSHVQIKKNLKVNQLENRVSD